MRELTYPCDGSTMKLALANCIGIGDGAPPKRQRPYRVLKVHWTAYFGIELASGVKAAPMRAQR